MTKKLAIPTAFWRKKEVVSFCLSILVFLTHISTFYNYRSIGQFSYFTACFWQFASTYITQFAVPLFFIISGALFFRDYSNKSYVPKIKSRIRSLLIPFLIWNTLCVLFDLVCTETAISNFFMGRKPFVLTAQNIMEGIFHYGRNLPFWFIFALMFFVVISPLIDLVLRNKYVGILSIAAIWALSLFEIGLPEPLFFKRNSIVFYLIGAYIGKHGFSLLLRPSRKWLQIFCVAFLVGVSILYFKFPSTLPDRLQIALFDVLNLLSAGAFWIAADLFAPQLGKHHFVDSSFAVFALHVNVSAIVTKLLFLALPQNSTMAIVNFLLTVVITLAIIALLHRFICRYFPKTSAVLFGKKPIQLKEDSSHG